MKYQNFAIALLFIALAARSSLPPMESSDSFNVVTYRGEVIPLSRMYVDFHDYKDDLNNLPADQVSRVAQLVRSAPVPKSFPSRKEADATVFKMMFPGYGLSMFQLHAPVALYSVEVPRMEEDRWLALVEKNGRWVVVDDFLWPVSAGLIGRAEYRKGHLRYLDRDGKVLREK